MTFSFQSTEVSLTLFYCCMNVYAMHKKLTIILTDYSQFCIKLLTINMLVLIGSCYSGWFVMAHNTVQAVVTSTDKRVIDLLITDLISLSYECKRKYPPVKEVNVT